MEKKFYEWSSTAKRLYFCKIDANRMSHGNEYKDINGDSGSYLKEKLLFIITLFIIRVLFIVVVDGVPNFVFFKKGAVVKTLCESVNYFKGFLAF